MISVKNHIDTKFHFAGNCIHNFLLRDSSNKKVFGMEILVSDQFMVFGLIKNKILKNCVRNVINMIYYFSKTVFARKNSRNI